MTPNIIITRGGFGRRAHTLFDEILEVVHWRSGSILSSAPTHYAVVIDKRGHLYLGTAHCSEKDQYRDWETDRKSTRLNSSHSAKSRMPSSA